MSKRRMCWAIIEGGNGSVVAIAPNKRAAIKSGKAFIQLPYRDAVRQVRKTVFVRDGGDCVKCGATLTWDSMHMHEKVPRGKGGRISLENCESLCFNCHLGPSGEHRRAPRFETTRT